jgi:hypothetical protein
LRLYRRTRIIGQKPAGFTASRKSDTDRILAKPKPGKFADRESVVSDERVW